MTVFQVTYEIATEASVEHGDYEEIGFEARDVSLREAVALVGHVYDCGSWFSESDGITDFATGAVTYHSLHPPRNITKSSYARLKRLLKA